MEKGESKLNTSTHLSLVHSYGYETMAVGMAVWIFIAMDVFLLPCLLHRGELYLLLNYESE